MAVDADEGRSARRPRHPAAVRRRRPRPRRRMARRHRSRSRRGRCRPLRRAGRRGRTATAFPTAAGGWRTTARRFAPGGRMRRLREIARRTGGELILAGTRPLSLGEYYLTLAAGWPATRKAPTPCRCIASGRMVPAAGVRAAGADAVAPETREEAMNDDRSSEPLAGRFPLRGGEPERSFSPSPLREGAGGGVPAPRASEGCLPSRAHRACVLPFPRSGRAALTSVASLCAGKCRFRARGLCRSCRPVRKGRGSRHRSGADGVQPGVGEVPPGP